MRSMRTLASAVTTSATRSSLAMTTPLAGFRGVAREAIDPERVAPEQLRQGFVPEPQRLDLRDGAFGVDHRVVRPEQHFVLPPAVDEAHELLRPVLRRVGVG